MNYQSNGPYTQRVNRSLNRPKVSLWRRIKNNIVGFLFLGGVTSFSLLWVLAVLASIAMPIVVIVVIIHFVVKYW